MDVASGEIVCTGNGGTILETGGQEIVDGFTPGVIYIFYDMGRAVKPLCDTPPGHLRFPSFGRGD